MATEIVATRYELRERIGAGGVAVVYRALDRRLGREVALKVLRAEFAQDQELLTRFEREARMVAGLNHPNIVRVDDYGAYGETFFIAMELVEGSNLKEHVRVRGPLGAAEAVRIAGELLSALAAAHARGLVHRDVKPQNVLIDRSGAVKLTDFGIAQLPSGTQLTQLGTTMGTAAYVAPEQATGAVVGAATDLYGIGLLLYEMLTGRAPFEGDSPAGVLYRHVHEAPRPPSALNPDVPAAVERVVLRALEKEPARRYGSAEEMARELAAAASEPVVVAAPAPLPPPMERTMPFPAVAPTGMPTTFEAAPAPAPTAVEARRRPGWLVPLLLAGAVLLLGVGVLLARPAGDGAPSPAAATAAATAAGSAIGAAAPASAPAAATATVAAAKPVAPSAPPTAAPKPTQGAPTAAAKPTPPAPTQSAPAPAAPTPAPPTAAPKPTAAPAPAKSAGVAGVVQIEDTALQGGYRNAGASIYRQRSATWVYGARTPYAAMTAGFQLPAAPSGPARLVVVGLDSEDDAKTPISVSVNGVEVFSGPAPFENDTHDADFAGAAAPWREQAWAIPEGALRAGANTLVIRSLADSASVGTPPFFMVDAARVEIGR